MVNVTLFSQLRLLFVGLLVESMVIDKLKNLAECYRHKFFIERVAGATMAA